MDETQRYLRQQDIVPREKLRQARVTVIGVGAIGRQVALQLTAIGTSALQLIDPDVVEEVNLPTQGYSESDLGRPKIEATAEACRRINSAVELHTEQARFRRSMATCGTIFVCVDSISTRQTIWQAVKDWADFLCDGRMAAESLRIVTACDPASRQGYATTLFNQDQAYTGACTARSTIYCANVAAGLMVGQFAKWLRGLPVDPDVCMNLLANEFNVLQAARVG